MTSCSSPSSSRGAKKIITNFASSPKELVDKKDSRIQGFKNINVSFVHLPPRILDLRLSTSNFRLLTSDL